MMEEFAVKVFIELDARSQYQSLTDKKPDGPPRLDKTSAWPSENPPPDAAG
jgi:hypothetical protein